ALVVAAPGCGGRRRRPGLPARPGGLRAAGLEAGLSRCQGASGQISRTAVFLAETGKARPTLPTVQPIAARTGKSLEYFLEGDGMGGAALRPDLERLRELAVRERWDDLAEAASAERDRATDPLDRAWIGYYLGRA